MKTILFALAILTMSGCSGLNQTDKQFSSHAESVNVLFLQIPGNTMERANNLVPKDADVKTVHSTPSGMTSVIGILNRLIGIETVSISGNLESE